MALLFVRGTMIPRRLLASVANPINANNPAAKDSTKLSSSSIRWAKRLGRVFGIKEQDFLAVARAKAIYENCCVPAQNKRFIEECGLPDTFQTWFSITQIHLWMCMVRLRAQGQAGLDVNTQLLDTFTHDMELRIHDLKVRRIQSIVNQFVSQFYGCSLAYDEGILSDDHVLFSAIWRNVTDMNGRPYHVARLLTYIRSEMQHLDTIPAADLNKGNFEWKSLSEFKTDL